MYSAQETTSRQLDMFKNISAESLVQNLLSAQKPDKTDSKENNLSVDFNVTYKVKKTKTTPPQGTGKQVRRTVRRDVVKSYRSTNKVSAEINDREKSVKAFYRQTERTASKINTVRQENYRGVRDKVAATFKYNFKLDLRFIQQFQTQSDRINNEYGEEALDNYVGATGTMVDRSLDMTRVFFDTVDSLLDNAKDSFFKRVDEFFDDLRSVYGESAALDADKETMINGAMSFFGEVKSLLDKAESTALNELESAGDTAAIPQNAVDENGDTFPDPQPETGSQV